jgi:hypothetical protein
MRHPRFAVLLALLPTLVAARQGALDLVEAAHPHSRPRFELPAGAEEVSVPFQLVNQHIVLPVLVNGAGPFRIVLDTGMPMEQIGLHDTAKTEALHLSCLDNVQVMVGGAGGSGKAKPVRMAEGLTLQIGDLKLSDAGATLLPPIPGFSAYSDGVIGGVLFRHFAVTVDNDRGLVILRRPESYQPPSGAAVLRLTRNHAASYVEATVQVGEAAPVSVSLVVDLGATHAVSLNEREEAGIVVPPSAIATTIGRGMSGYLEGRVGRIRSIELGGLKLTDVVATFPDRRHQSPRGMDSRDGNLGNGVLSRFNVTFDCAGERMVLQPARRFTEPFEWDMSGIQAEPTPDGSMRVREVLANSPAAEAGVRKEDLLVRIAGRPVDAKNYFDLREKLRKAGDTVPVELRRGKKQVDVSLKLRRLI